MCVYVTGALKMKVLRNLPALSCFNKLIDRVIDKNGTKGGVSIRPIL